jgi:PAS domain S-box-containing protein
MKKTLLLFFLIIFLNPFISNGKENKKNILIISSYHKGFSFTDRIITGIETYFKREASFTTSVYVEYLDFLRVPQTKLQKKNLIQFLKNRYENIKFDALITVDPEAFLFINEYEKYFVKTSKKFYCGITQEIVNSIKNINEYLGLTVDYDFKRNFELANHLLPNRNNYYILLDSSLLGNSIFNQIKKIENYFKDKKFIFIRDLSFNELLNTLKSDENNSVIFPFIYTRDKYDNLYQLEDIISLLSNRIKSPIIGFIDVQANRGILCGYLYMGYRQGQLLGKLIDEYLNYNRINDSILSVRIQYTNVFSYPKLEEYNIPITKLPLNAIIMDKPPNYYQKYLKVLLPYLILIFSLIVFVIILFWGYNKLKKVTKNLKNSEELYRLLVSNIKDVIFRFELYPTTHYTFISPSVYDLIGIKPEEVYNNPKIFFKHLSEEYHLFFKNLLSGNIIFDNTYEIKWKLPENKIIWTEVKYIPIYDNNNKLIAIEGISRDITKRKNYFEELRLSQERLKLVLQSNKDGIWDWDIPSGKITVDDRWIEIIEYNRDEIQPTFDFWKDSLHNDDKEATLQILNNHLSGNNEYYEAEFRMKTKSNRYKWILSRGKVVERNSDGTPIRMTGTHTDITEKKKNELELLKIKKLESLGTLAGGIAHDFNNILTAILGNVSLAKLLLKSNKDIEKVYNLINSSENATLRAKELTQKLLAFSKGGKPIKIKTNIKEILNETIQLIDEPLIKFDVKFISNPWALEADPSQIKQTLHSIIINAIESMNNIGLIKISIRNYKVNRNIEKNPYLQKEHYIKIEIKDEGCGINRENLEKVFDPYFTTKPRAGGLGLSVANAIIQNHEGYLTLSSIPQKGTTVTIYLPALVTEAKENPKNTKIISNISIDKAKILVMDDDEYIRDLLFEALSNLGYSIELAIDGNEAINKYVESLNMGSPFDLVILDLTIPGGKGGKETIKELLSIDPEVKAIVSSGYSNDPILSSYYDYGFKGIIKKPYDINTLENTIKNVLS